MSDAITCPKCGHAFELQDRMREHLLRELGAEYQSKLKSETARLRKELESAARTAVSDEVQELREKLASTTAAEVALRKERRDLEAQTRDLELAVHRKLDEERDLLREQARVQLEEQNRHLDADKEKLITDLRRQIDDMKRTAEFRSQQAMGFTHELELENELRRHFPADVIEAVPGGMSGGDVLHHVHDRTGARCGTILWESKRTKSWNDQWLPKLREDQRRARADFAAIRSVEMPKGVDNFTCIDGTWVTNRACSMGLAAALRAGLIEAARARESAHGKMNKVDLVFQYFAGSEFRQKIEGMIEAWVGLKKDLDSEKRSMSKIWNKRERQIGRAMANTTALYGDLCCIIGPSLPAISHLELDAIAAPDGPACHDEETEVEYVGF
jgi:hypothetical protein